MKKFESLTGVSFSVRGLQLEMSGISSKLEKASALVELTRPIWEQGLEVPDVDLKAAFCSLNIGQATSHAELGKKILARSKGGKYLRPRTIRQKAYVEAIENYDLTFAIGPAGTGKTFLATVLTRLSAFEQLQISCVFEEISYNSQPFRLSLKNVI